MTDHYGSEAWQVYNEGAFGGVVTTCPWVLKGDPPSALCPVCRDDDPSIAGQCDTMYHMKNDRLFSFRLPDADLTALEQIAEAEERTIADIVRRAIRHELARTLIPTKGDHADPA